MSSVPAITGTSAGAERAASADTGLVRRLFGWGDAVLLAALLVVPWFLQAVGSYTDLGTYVLVWGLAAMGLNVLLGYAGSLSFGHAGFFGLGAYGAGLALKHVAANTLLAVGCGVVLGTVAAAVLGLLIIRLRGIYFATFTIAFGQLFFFIAFQLRELTGGDDGLRGFARQPLGPWDITGSEGFYYFVLALFVLAAVVMRIVVRSPLGRSFIALCENPQRARFLGLNVEGYLWLAFVISAAFTSLAGALLGLLINFAQPSMLHWTTSGEIVMMAFLGGTRAFYGPLLGAGLYKVLEELLSSYTANWMIFLGALFVLAVLFFPRGLAGIFQRRN